MFLFVWLLGLLQPATAQNNALHFDGSGDYVMVPDNNALDVSSAFTIECWVYRTAQGHNTLVSKWDDDNHQRGWMLNFGEHSPNTLSVLLTTNGNWNPSPYLQWNSTVTVPLNVWTHIAVTFSSTGTDNVKVYKNGVLGGQTTWAYPVHTSTTNLFIGGYDGWLNGFNAGANSRFFAGGIDNLRIWNTTRTATEIADNYHCTVSPASSGLVALYEFNQGTASGSNTGISSLTNATANPLNGTLTGFAKTGTTSNFVPGAPAGVASVSIVSNDADNALCNGTTATFTATGAAGGSGATYQWYRNSVPEGTASTSNTLTLTNLAQGNAIYCTMTSTLSCVAVPTVTSNTITISLLTTPTCTNGGTLTSDCGCTCQPGFTGPTCATAVATTAQGLDFDGNNSNYGIVPSAFAPSLTGTQATLEAWVKRRNTGVYYPLLKKGYSHWGLGITGAGQLEWMNDYYSEYGIMQTSNAITVPENDWTHVAIVADGGNYTFYIDGQLVETVTGSPFNDNNGYDLALGYNPYGGNLDGGLDEVRIWNVARSQAQIQAAMNTELSGSETGLKAYYKFNQTSGTILSDAVGCANADLYNFAMSGTTSNWETGATLNSATTVSAAPELAVYGPLGTEMANYGTNDLGAQAQNTIANYTITLTNIGTGVLNLSGFSVYSSYSYYSLVSGPAVTSLAAGQSTTATISLDTYNGVAPYGGGYDDYFSFSTNDCDESNVYYYLSARGINGQVDPHRGNMLRLDGTGDFVQCTSPSSLDFVPSDAFCGEAWVKTSNTTAGTMQIFSKRTSSDGWGFSLENGRPTLSFAGGGNLQTYTNGSIPVVTDGEWHHLAFSYEYGSTNMFLYVDGLPFSGSSADPTPASGSSGIDFCIGAADPNSPFGFFDGEIEEVRIWSDTRQQTDIREKMHLTLTGSENSLVSYFQFNESTGNVTDVITGNNGSLQGDASRIASTLSVAAGFTHERVLNGPGNYTFGPFTIGFTAMSAPGGNDGFFVSQLNDFPLNNVSGLPGTALSHWVIRQAGTQTFSYNTITTVLPVGTVISAADAATPSNFKLYKRETNSAGSWTEIGYGISANIASRTVVFSLTTPLSSFSEFVAGSSGGTFPVEWLSFEAERAANGYVQLDWITASEHNNVGFGVEYSLDGTSFMELGFVPGAGTSELPQEYRYEAPVLQAAYFRLKQTDVNGSASYSETRYVAADQANVWYFAPNPVRGEVKLHGVFPADSYVRTTVHGVDGRLLLDHIGTDAEAAVNEALSGFAPGLYLFQLRVDGKSVATQQMVVE